jgi:hypothetical protein
MLFSFSGFVAMDDCRELIQAKPAGGVLKLLHYSDQLKCDVITLYRAS